jgi:uncharacterized protein (DUF1778 family)
MSDQSRSSVARPKERLDRFTEIPARLVLDDADFERVVVLLEHPPTPTDALRQLTRSQDR